MKLSKVTLKGFRSHHSTTANLQDYTCIIGRNDCGKSAFLRAVRLLLDPRVKPVPEDQTKIDPIPTEALIEAEFSEVPANWPIGAGGVLKLRRRVAGVPLRWELEGMVPVDPDLRDMSVGQTTKGAIQKSSAISADIKSELDAMPDGPLKPDQWISLYKSIDEKGLVEKHLDWGPVPENTISSLFQVVFLAADTKAEDQVGGAKSVFDDLGGMLIREAARSSQAIAEKTAELQVLLNELVEKDGDGKWAYAPLNKMEEILKGEIALFDRDITLVHQPTAPILGDHRFGMTLDVADPHVSGISNMGHGFRRSLIFAMLRTFVRMSEIVVQPQQEANHEGSQTFERFTVFLIEEPELYLHPQAERARMSELRDLSERDFTQVIVCTHSAFFIDMSRYRSIVRLERADRQASRVWAWSGNDLDTDEQEKLKAIRSMHPTSAAALFADLAILAEGPTEVGCLPILAKRLGIDTLAVEIVDCGGAGSVPTLARVCDAFGVKYTAWFDQDRPVDIAKAIAQATVGRMALIVLDPDWEAVAGVPAGAGGKPWRSYYHFVLHNAAIPPQLAHAIQSAYNHTNMDMRP